MKGGGFTVGVFHYIGRPTIPSVEITILFEHGIGRLQKTSADTADPSASLGMTRGGLWFHERWWLNGRRFSLHWQAHDSFGRDAGLRESSPQRLKPNSLQSSYVRPKGRTLQRSEFFRNL
jgi:hypothetical protein